MSIQINTEGAAPANGSALAHALPERAPDASTQPLRPASDQLVARCRELAPKLAARAAHYDRTGTFPVENFSALREAGLMGMLVPTWAGGFGADFLTYTKAMEQLAMGDGATALAFNMHHIAVGSLAELDWQQLVGRRGEAMQKFARWVFGEAQAGKLFASAASEPGIGSHLSKVKTSYRPAQGGYVLNGTKSFVSMAGHAEYYLVACRPESAPAETPAVSYLVVERENPGISIDEVWDVMGMRGTSSNTMHFKDCFVPSERLFLGIEGMALYKALREPHWIAGSYNAVYLGIANAVFEFTTNYLRGRKAPGGESLVSQDKLVQHRVGEMYTALESARGAVYQAAELVARERGSQAANLAIHRAKYTVGELGPWLASHAIRLCGGSSISKRFPLERYYRDARCGGLMPATSDDCLVYLGKAMLGIDVKAVSESYL